MSMRRGRETRVLTGWKVVSVPEGLAFDVYRGEPGLTSNRNQALYRDRG